MDFPGLATSVSQAPTSQEARPQGGGPKGSEPLLLPGRAQISGGHELLLSEEVTPAFAEIFYGSNAYIK